MTPQMRTVRCSREDYEKVLSWDGMEWVSMQGSPNPFLTAIWYTLNVRIKARFRG